MGCILMIKQSIGGVFWWIRQSNSRTFGIVLILVFLLLSLIGEWVAPYSLEQHFERYLFPNPEHLLGTDDLGRDIFSEILYGTKLSIFVGIIAATISIFVGVTVGVVAGYWRGKIEQIMLSVTDVAIVIPTLPLLMILVMYMDRGVLSLAIAISIVGWCGMARILHPRVINIKQQAFVEAARAMGKSDLYIIVHHIIPNCKEVIAAKFSLAVGGAMLAESSMAFIGFGDPLHLSWGGIINEAYTNGALGLDLWWWYVVPAVLISFSIIAFMLVGNSKNEDRWVVD